ncbi:hypothetical protein M758_7G075700 [Ceratodon purpureus]|nr:hypothetical protein M758_7G075700 [Ceratodon purpureus]
MAMMLARRKGVSLATDYLVALRRTTSSLRRGAVEGTGFVGRNSEVGAAVETAFGIGSRRGIGGFARWEGGLGLGQKQLQVQQGQKQGLAIVGRRNFNLASLRDRFKGATGKVTESAGIAGAKKTVIGYREAFGLQLESFWKRNYLVVVGALGFGVCLLLWRVMFGIASTFVSLSEGMAKFGFLALAAAMVTVGGVWLRSRFQINPDAVYRMAMRKLNTSAPVLEVMGAPLTGTELRAYVMSGGGLRIKNFRPRLSNKRCFIIFPISGTERKGLVSIEVKKKKGQYDFKLLAVDIPTAGAEHRVYLIGDENEYQVGGGLISVLRDPIVKAMAAQKEFEEHDEKEEQDDLQREWEAEQARERERIERLEREAAAAEQAEEEAADKELQKSQEAERLREPEPMKA